jgi:restriction system protein
MARSRKKNNELFISVIVLIGLLLFGKILSHKNLVYGIFHVFIIAIAIMLVFSVLILLYRQHQKARMRDMLLAAGADNPMQLTPEKYEKFCSALLENNGWRTTTTIRTGDYGADIVATKMDQKIVVQCKQWSKSVGIKAVQEAHAALSYYKANKALVVSTSGYTAAAKNLSRSTGVMLLSHEDLTRDFEKWQKLEGKKPL